MAVPQLTGDSATDGPIIHQFTKDMTKFKETEEMQQFFDSTLAEIAGNEFTVPRAFHMS